MTRFKLTIEYDGSGYSGWQRQPDVPSVQAEIEAAIMRFCQQEVTLTCAGRTDAGVHARGQVAHLDLDGEIDAFRLREALNAHLRGRGIAIIESVMMPESFNARFDAHYRHYRYRIINRRAPLVLEAGRAWQIPHTLDVEAMRQAATHLLGHHDFSSFRDSQCQAKSPMRTLDRLDITHEEDHITLYVGAPSFLHHQVRIITGTLVEVARGKRSADDMPDILAAKRRAAAGATALACGLYFMQADYP